MEGLRRPGPEPEPGLCLLIVRVLSLALESICLFLSDALLSTCVAAYPGTLRGRAERWEKTCVHTGQHLLGQETRKTR